MNMAKRIEKETGMETKSTFLVTWKCGGSLTAKDRVYASIMDLLPEIFFLKEKQTVAGYKHGEYNDFDIGLKHWQCRKEFRSTSTISQNSLPSNKQTDWMTCMTQDVLLMISDRMIWHLQIRRNEENEPIGSDHSGESLLEERKALYSL